jgi:hypothetical protein
MNSLSWVLYLADIVGGLANGAIAVCIVLALAALMVPMIMDGYDEKEARNKVMKRLAIVFGICASIAVFVPSKNTIYAIAASEYGAEALKTPEATKARQALNAWLDKQIEQKPEQSK